MRALIRAEVRKLTTVRTGYTLLAAMLALVALSAVATIATAGNAAGTFSLDTARGVRAVFGSGWPASFLVLVLGILGVSGEFRHGTVTPAFLITPHRSRIVAAKLVTYFLVGLAFGVAALVVTLAIAVPWLAAKDVSYSLVHDVLAVAAGVLLATALYGVLGVGVGALVKNQAAAITVAVVWSSVLESPLVGLLPEVGKWGPVGSASALSGGSSTEGALLAPWTAGLLLLAYGVLLASVGTRFVAQRDIT